MARGSERGKSNRNKRNNSFWLFLIIFSQSITHFHQETEFYIIVFIFHLFHKPKVHVWFVMLPLDISLVKKILRSIFIRFTKGLLKQPPDFNNLEREGFHKYFWF